MADSKVRKFGSNDVDNLWRKYFNERSIDLRNKLVEHYRPLVHMLGMRLVQKLPAVVSYDEICSAGYDGLMNAVESYSPRKGAGFETFCQPRIRGAVIDWLRNFDEQSRAVRAFEKRRALCVDNLSARICYRPTEQEILEFMGMP